MTPDEVLNGVRQEMDATRKSIDESNRLVRILITVSAMRGLNEAILARRDPGAGEMYEGEFSDAIGQL